jgi:hypothetical protein
MAGQPKRRTRRGEVVKPWRVDPSLSSRPPFAAGNEASLRHGAFSKRRFEPVAQELMAGVLEDRPDLGRYPEALAAWADSEARAWLLRDWLTEHGMFIDGETAEGVLKWLVAFDKRAEAGRVRLGLDPRSEAELANAQADAERSVVDLDALRAAGREAIEARAARDGGGET